MSDATSTTVSPRKLRANRRNARKSTGPRTPEGQTISSRNATTHGLFCRDVILPGESEEGFHALRHAMLIALAPQDIVELMYCDRIVQAQWRMNRLRADERFAHLHVADRMTKSTREQSDRLAREDYWDVFGDENEEETPQEIADRLKRAEEMKELLRLSIPENVVEHMRMHGAVYEEDSDGDPLPHEDLEGKRWDRALRYERHLELTISRAMRELRQYRTPIKGEKPRKPCPFVPESYYTARHPEDIVYHTTPDDAEAEAEADEFSKCENEATVVQEEDNSSSGTGLQPVREMEIDSRNQELQTEPHRSHGLKTRATGEEEARGAS